MQTEFDAKFKRDCWEMFWWARRNVLGGQESRRARCYTQPVGWRGIGKGWYSKAWLHKDSGLVLKVSGPPGASNAACDHTSRERTARDPWQLFARTCQQSTHENLPDILWFEQVSVRYAFAVMPRYYTGDTEEFRLEVHDALSGKYECPAWLIPVLQIRDATNCHVDLHDGNAMLKADGTHVLIDPFSWLTEGNQSCC